MLTHELLCNNMKIYGFQMILITKLSKCGGEEIAECICAECLFLFLFSWCVDCLLTANYMIFFVVV